jgi:hypothetical protein
MRFVKAFFCVLLFLIGPEGYSYSGKLEDSNLEKEKLNTILKNCADYCTKLKNSALFFVCREKINEELFQRTRVFVKGKGSSSKPPAYYRLSGKTKNEYIYDYQLIKKGSKIEESRILLEENGVKKNKKDAPMKTKRFYSYKSVFGPVGLLSKEFQDIFDYKFVKEAKLKSLQVYIIEAIPKKNIEERPNYGKIWVDKKDFSVVKIEMLQESLHGFEAFSGVLDDSGIKPDFKTIHFYEIKKNGIRFPSRTEFEEAYKGRRTPKFKRSKVLIKYDQYQFFTVETTVKYKE